MGLKGFQFYFIENFWVDLKSSLKLNLGMIFSIFEHAIEKVCTGFDLKDSL